MKPSSEGFKVNNKTFLTMSYRIKPDKKEYSKQDFKFLRLLSKISKNLYNSALYLLRQNYIKNKTVISYYSLNKLLNSNPNFHIINTYTSICTIRNAYNAFNNFHIKQRKTNEKLKPLSKGFPQLFKEEQLLYSYY